jgi:hypothetical protein
MLKRGSRSTQKGNYTSANLCTTNPTYSHDCDFPWHSFMFCYHKHSDTHIKHFVTAAKQFLLVARSSLWERLKIKCRGKNYRQKRWKYEGKCRVQIIRKFFSLYEYRWHCIMHKFVIYLSTSIYFCLTCFGLTFSPSSGAGVQLRQWF